MKQAVKNAKTDSQVDIGSKFGMTAQVIVGQRVRAPDGKDVMKFALISFAIPPGIEDKGPEIIREAMMRAHFPSGRIVAFNTQGSLYGLLRPTDQMLDAHADVVSGFYGAVESVVRKHHPLQDHEYVRGFYDMHAAREMGLPALTRDVANLLRSPTLTRITWDDTLRFGPLFRMELYYDGEKFYTYGPNNTMVEYNAGIVSDVMNLGHRAYMEMLLSDIAAAFAAGAPGVLGYQVDSTLHVGSCGASAKSIAFYKRGMAAAATEATVKSRTEDNLHGADLKILVENETSQDRERARFLTSAEAIRAEAIAARGSFVCPSCGAPISGGHVCGKVH